MTRSSFDVESALVDRPVFEGKHLIQVDCPQDPLQSFWVRVKSKKGTKSFPYEGQEWYQLCSSGFELQAEDHLSE